MRGWVIKVTTGHVADMRHATRTTKRMSKHHKTLADAAARHIGNTELVAVPLCIDRPTLSYTDELQDALGAMPEFATQYGYSSFWLTAADEAEMATTLARVRARNPTRMLFTVDRFMQNIANGGVVTLCVMLSPGIATRHADPVRQLIGGILDCAARELHVDTTVQQTAIDKVWAAKHPRPSSAPRPAIKKSKKAR
jgi:hypothetical protein